MEKDSIKQEWVKAHIDSTDNEMADKEAKEYINKDYKTMTGFPRSYF